jgi:hypothetical protein
MTNTRLAWLATLVFINHTMFALVTGNETNTTYTCSHTTMMQVLMLQVDIKLASTCTG